MLDPKIVEPVRVEPATDPARERVEEMLNLGADEPEAEAVEL